MQVCVSCVWVCVIECVTWLVFSTSALSLPPSSSNHLIRSPLSSLLLYTRPPLSEVIGKNTSNVNLFLLDLIESTVCPTVPNFKEQCMWETLKVESAMWHHQTQRGDFPMTYFNNNRWPVWALSNLHVRHSFEACRHWKDPIMAALADSTFVVDFCKQEVNQQCMMMSYCWLYL